ncbi:MAG: patatin-like phospholipase family protein [Gammaproteobacteria bacterium]
MTGRAPVSILSLDGGGSRCILQLLLLHALELEIRRQNDNPDLYLVDYFDLVAGTSCGGIIAAMMVLPDLEHPDRPAFSMADICTSIQQYLPMAFSNISDKGHIGILKEKYNGRSLSALLRSVFSGARLSNALKPCLIPAYDVEANRARFFCSHDYYDQKRCAALGVLHKGKSVQDWLLRDVCRATSAAPIFFEPASIAPLAYGDGEQTQMGDPRIFIDGGVFANNPALCAYGEIRSKWQGGLGIKDMFMVSLGTGISPLPLESGGYIRAWKGGVKLVNFLFAEATQAIHMGLEQIFSLEYAHRYHRFNWDIDEMLSLDDVSDASIENMYRTFTGLQIPPRFLGQSAWIDMGAEAARWLPPHLRTQVENVAQGLRMCRELRLEQYE